MNGALVGAAIVLAGSVIASGAYWSYSEAPSDVKTGFSIQCVATAVATGAFFGMNIPDPGMSNASNVVYAGLIAWLVSYAVDFILERHPLTSGYIAALKAHNAKRSWFSSSDPT